MCRCLLHPSANIRALAFEGQTQQFLVWTLQDHEPQEFNFRRFVAHKQPRADMSLDKALLPIARRPAFFGCEANPTRKSVFKWTCPARKSPNLCSFSGQVTMPPGCLAAACCLKDTRVTSPALMRIVFCGSSSLTRCQRRFANLRELVESW